MIFLTLLSRPFYPYFRLCVLRPTPRPLRGGLARGVFVFLFCGDKKKLRLLDEVGTALVLALPSSFKKERRSSPPALKKKGGRPLQLKKRKEVVPSWLRKAVLWAKHFLKKSNYPSGLSPLSTFNYCIIGRQARKVLRLDKNCGGGPASSAVLWAKHFLKKSNYPSGLSPLYISFWLPLYDIWGFSASMRQFAKKEVQRKVLRQTEGAGGACEIKIPNYSE